MSRIVKSMALASVALTAALAASVGNAQTIEVVTAGSSAQWGVFGAAAYQLAINSKPSGGSVGHYTVKGTCGTLPCAYISDTRNSAISNAAGNIWIVWNATSSGTVQNVWAYLSIDSTIGDRGFLSKSSVKLSASAPSAGQNLLAVWSDGSTDSALPATILAAFDSSSGETLTAANTDIRPEDALFATERALSNYCGLACPPSPNPYNMPSTDWAGLGYGSSTNGVGTDIESTFTAASAASLIQPVIFALSGTDPLKSSMTVPTWTTIPIGAAPVVFLANDSTGSSVAAATSISQNQTIYLFSGNTDDPGSLTGGCVGTNVTGGTTGNVFPILREPTSGTYSTFEYNIIRTSSTTNDSQEAGINPANSGANPLSQACNDGGGSRYRSTGTGDTVSDVNSTTGALGYAFFSYEAVPTTDSLRYLEYTGKDPLANSATATYSGTIPACASTIGGNTEHWCPGTFTPGTTFANVRTNAYPVWSTYRMVTSPSGTNYTNNLALVNAAEQVAAFDLPDFIPFEPQCGSTVGATANDPGLQEYREHFYWNFGTGASPIYPSYEPTTANDGPNMLGTSGKTCTIGHTSTTYYSWALGGYVSGSSNTETGGDVGGPVVNNSGNSTTAPGATPPGATLPVRTTY